MEQNPDELAMINYTSGTTGFSKGVMVPYRALWGNADFAEDVLGKKIKPGDSIISILPMAHMYGMAFEFIFEFIKGCHIFYLTRIPSPAIIAEAFGRIKPAVIISVPLVIEKIIRKKVFPRSRTTACVCCSTCLHQQEGEGEDMRPGIQCLRWQLLRGDYWWCSL